MDTPPQTAHDHAMHGMARREMGDLDGAIASLRRAVAIDASLVEACDALGGALVAKGDLVGAATSHCLAGTALRERGRADEALAAYRRALALCPEHAPAHLGIGFIQQHRTELKAAAASYQRALAIDPGLAAAYNNLANILRLQGCTSEAVAFYRHAAELLPDNLQIHSNLLLGLQYDPAATPAALLLEHRAYAAKLSHKTRAHHANQRDPDKRLKVGYVSPDFHRHPVAFMLMPVMASHDHANFEIYCYYGLRVEDTITEALKRGADFWRPVYGTSDDALAQMIVADGIDVLVDLAGHTGRNRLPVFASKPAPVQVTWAGYVGTTGLDAIDHLITDRWHSPPGSERYASERLVRLPDGYACWAVPQHAPEVGPLPATRPGAVTFGCFNSLAKINRPVVALWGRLLRELPASCLVLKTLALGDAAARDGITALFAAEGIAADRVALEGDSPHADLLRRYNAIDIALDPFPYSGGLTTVEALWMGVPVVTMPGQRFSSRHSFSHLSNAGLGEMVADGPEAYIRIATELAYDLPRLAALRAGMRDRLRASPLLQAKRFTRGLEAAYRAMWHAWCEAAA